MSKYIPYGRQYIDDDDINAVVDVLRSDMVTQGPNVGELEGALSAYCGAKHAVAVSSGTAALHAAYWAAGIGPGDEIITSPITFVATANAALYLGAKPVFVDIQPGTGNLDPEKIEAAITPHTKALVPVHFAGIPVDIKAVREIADRHGLMVIEDACHALGASFEARKIGALSEMTVFSFHPLKSITTGEGGAVLTDIDELAERLGIFRLHGITKDEPYFKKKSDGPWYYEMQALGYNYRMSDIHAALGISQLAKLDRFIEKRTEIASFYDRAFEGNGYFQTPVVGKSSNPSWHLYPIRLVDGIFSVKGRLVELLRQSGLGVQVHYIPVYAQPYYRDNGYDNVTCPVADDFYLRELSIPIHQGMSDADTRYVSKALLETLSKL